MGTRAIRQVLHHKSSKSRGLGQLVVHIEDLQFVESTKRFNIISIWTHTYHSNFWRGFNTKSKVFGTSTQAIECGEIIGGKGRIIFKFID